MYKLAMYWKNLCILIFKQQVKDEEEFKLEQKKIVNSQQESILKNKIRHGCHSMKEKVVHSINHIGTWVE